MGVWMDVVLSLGIAMYILLAIGMGGQASMHAYQEGKVKDYAIQRATYYLEEERARYIRDGKEEAGDVQEGAYRYQWRWENSPPILKAKTFYRRIRMVVYYHDKEVLSWYLAVPKVQKKDGGFIYVELLWSLFLMGIILTSVLPVVGHFEALETHITQSIEYMQMHRLAREVIDKKVRFTMKEVRVCPSGQNVESADGWGFSVGKHNLQKILEDGTKQGLTGDPFSKDMRRYRVESGDEGAFHLDEAGVLCCKWHAYITGQKEGYHVDTGVQAFPLEAYRVKYDANTGHI